MLNFVELNEANFDRAIGSGICVVGFCTSHCFASTSMEPLISQVVEKYQTSVKLYRVDIEDELGLSVRFEIQSIPTVIIFKDGQEASRIEGAKSNISKLIEEKIAQLVG